MKIIKTEKLPSTINDWGFAGSIKKVKHTMENGDVWVTGTACYRHAPESKWTNLLPAAEAEKHPDWTGNITINGVVTFNGAKSKGWIEARYKK